MMMRKNLLLIGLALLQGTAAFLTSSTSHKFSANTHDHISVRWHASSTAVPCQAMIQHHQHDDDVSLTDDDDGKDIIGDTTGIINRRILFQATAAAAAVTATTLLPMAAFADNNNNNDVETKSPFIAFANNFVRDDNNNNDEKISSSSSLKEDPLDTIAWDGPKKRNLTMEQMADAINDGLVELEWFVTGQGKPELFSNNFIFSDPQVSLVGFESYCRGVRRLFDQDTARCEVVCCSVTAPNTVTVLWRNSGRVSIGPVQIELKPYLVTTTLKTDPDDGNLIVSQIDEFDSDTLGLLFYQVPSLRGLAGPPAPSLDVLKQQCDFNTCKM